MKHEQELKLRFFLYYRKDPDHCGDLEGARLKLTLVQTGGHWEARVREAMGLAHGNLFYNNRLRIGEDSNAALGLRLPLTLLLEENKHATVPDRNGDGVYTPGYDVNIGIYDAWGLRDNFGSKVVATNYEASMSKLTRIGAPGRRLFPPLPDGEHVVQLRWQGDTPDAWRSDRTYRLVHTSELPRAGRYNPRNGATSSGLREVLSVFLGAFAFRYDGVQRDGVLAVPVLFDAPPMQPLPVLRWAAGFRVRAFTADGDRRWSTDILVSRSLGGRLSGWYVAAGRFKSNTTDRFRALPFEYEAGIRFRLKPTVLGGWLPIFGARLGVRTDSWSVSGARVVVEIGGGLL